MEGAYAASVSLALDSDSRLALRGCPPKSPCGSVAFFFLVLVYRGYAKVIHKFDQMSEEVQYFLQLTHVLTRIDGVEHIDANYITPLYSNSGSPLSLVEQPHPTHQRPGSIEKSP